MRTILKNISLITISILVILPACGKKNKKQELIQQKEYPRILDYNDTRPIVVSIHGTLPPLTNIILNRIDAPIGLAPAVELNRRFLLARFLYLLSEGDPDQYPIESCYSFGWSGSLTFSARKCAAEMLYEQLKGYKGPITLIGHSHGGNVALEVARYAALHHDTEFVIDKLVLLATPIQEATAAYASSDTFNEVISLYSMGDFTQVVDPQGTYSEARYIEQSCNVKVPLFSQRKLQNFLNVVQARILINGGDPGHLDFIRTTFVHQLPAVIDLLSQVNACEDYVVYVPKCMNKKPYFIELRKVKNKKKWVKVE